MVSGFLGLFVFYDCLVFIIVFVRVYVGWWWGLGAFGVCDLGFCFDLMWC